jgi:hypothetical protein
MFTADGLRKRLQQSTRSSSLYTAKRRKRIEERSVQFCVGPRLEQTGIVLPLASSSCRSIRQESDLVTAMCSDAAGTPRLLVLAPAAGQPVRCDICRMQLKGMQSYYGHALHTHGVRLTLGRKGRASRKSQMQLAVSEIPDLGQPSCTRVRSQSPTSHDDEAVPATVQTALLAAAGGFHAGEYEN